MPNLSGDDVGKIGNVPYVELPGSGRIEYGQESITAVRIFRIRYSDVRLFLDAMLGQRVDYGIYPQTVENPENAQFSKDFTTLTAVRANVEPSWGDRQRASFGQYSLFGARSISYEYADVTVYYERVTDYSLEVEFGTEVISVAAENWVGETSSAEPASSVQIKLPVADIIMTMYASHMNKSESDIVSFNNITDHLGKINQTAITLSGDAVGSAAYLETNSLACAAETLLFESVEIVPVNCYMNNDLRLTYHFRWRRESWNKTYRIDADSGSRWEYVSDADNSVRPYDTVEFDGTVIPAYIPQAQFYDRWR